MTGSFERFDPAAFEARIAAWNPRRRIDTVHIHCTDRPRHADWRGLASMEAMRQYHLRIGMSDIAQHVTVDPQGGIWTGRPFDVPPASVRGHNGTREVGPFMIEMVGLFENRTDPFVDPQASAVYAVVVAVLRKFRLDEKCVKFHREFPKVAKTCPGMDLDPKDFRNVIASLLKGDEDLPEAARASRAVQRKLRLAAPIDAGDALRSADGVDPAEGAGDCRDFEVPEDANSLAAQQALAELLDGAGLAEPDEAGRTALRAPGSTCKVDPRFSDLVGHVVNTSKGVLSGRGLMRQTADDLDILIRHHLTPAFAEGGMKHVLFYAHGGLVREESALCYARTMLPWWLARGVYPIFFIWESDLIGTLRRRPRAAARGFGDWWDKLVEVTTQPFARRIWARMKADARANSEPVTAFGTAGGLYQFAQRFNAWFDALPADRRPDLHAVGHSTGPILLARFMPLIWRRATDPKANQPARPFASLSYLAPAIRIDDFATEVLDHVGASQPIRALDIYTMNEYAEKADSVIKIYRKSLLYFVRDACEDHTGGRILGLQEDLFADPDCVATFGLRKTSDLSASNPGRATRIEFSQHKDQLQQNPATRAVEHGAFDNDEATMTSVLGRIAGTPPSPGPIRFPSAEELSRCERERLARGGLDDDDPERVGLAEDEVDTDADEPRDAGPPVGPCPCCPCLRQGEPSAFDAPADAVEAAGAVAGGEGGNTPADAWSGPASPPTIGGARTGRRLAVCIGIDAYRVSPLAGCVNDSRAWRRRLEKLGFTVHALVDREATRAAIADALAELVGRARSGDELVFQFAGHGSQVKDLDGDETDPYDEVLCPVDYHNGELLTDDDIYAATAKLGLAPGAHLTFITDCCHSGTNTRAAPSMRSRDGDDSRNRWIKLSEAVVEKYVARRKGAVRAAATFGRPSERDPLPGVVSFAACQDHEVALERGGQGDFTRHALAVIDGVIAQNGSNAAFLAAVRRRFGSAPAQNPRMDLLPALRRRPFLGGKP